MSLKTFSTKDIFPLQNVRNVKSNYLTVPGYAFSASARLSSTQTVLTLAYTMSLINSFFFPSSLKESGNRRWGWGRGATSSCFSVPVLEALPHIRLLLLLQGLACSNQRTKEVRTFRIFVTDILVSPVKYHTKKYPLRRSAKKRGNPRSHGHIHSLASYSINSANALHTVLHTTADSV